MDYEVWGIRRSPEAVARSTINYLTAHRLSATLGPWLRPTPLKTLRFTAARARQRRPNGDVKGP